MGTHLRVLRERYSRNTNRQVLEALKSLHPCDLHESSLSIGRVKIKENRAYEDAHSLSWRATPRAEQTGVLHSDLFPQTW